jgi:hypothetical protein
MNKIYSSARTVIVLYTLLCIITCNCKVFANESENHIFRPSLREDVNKFIQNMYNENIVKDLLKIDDTKKDYRNMKDALQQFIVTQLQECEKATFNHDLVVRKSSLYILSANFQLDKIIPLSVNDLDLCLAPDDTSSTFDRITEKREVKPTDRPAIYLIRSCGKNAIPYLTSWILDEKNPLLLRLQSAALFKEIDTNAAAKFFDLFLSQEQNKFLVFGLSALQKYLIYYDDPIWGFVCRGRLAQAQYFIEKMAEK